jgi:uncharacterized coiled-coil DUF342 family protein
MDFLKMIFLEKHEIIYNVMMIVMGIIVYVLISWLRKAYRILESGNIPAGDPEAFKKFTKEHDAMFAEAKNLTTNLNRKVDDLYGRINKWDTQIITLQKGADELKKVVDTVQRSGAQGGKTEEILNKVQNDYKDLMAKMSTLQRGTEEAKKQIENVQKIGGQSGKAEEMVVKIQEEYKNLVAKFGALEKGTEETKKQIENVQRAGGQSGKAEEILYKMQEEHKELFTNINKRIEDLYDKTRRFNEWLVNSQKQLEESGKLVTKMQGSLAEISKMPKETAKAPELDKFAKSLEENSKYVHKVNADIEHMHNKMVEQEDQINDLKRIFEDMDATFAEMNKRFQKIETVERGN